MNRASIEILWGWYRPALLLVGILIGVVSPVPAQVSWQWPSSDFYAVATRDAETFVAVGGQGKIMVGDDGGRRWSYRASPIGERLQGVAFASRMVGVAVGARGTILRTTDAGDTWRKVTDTTTVSLSDVTAVSATELVAVGEAGRVIRSLDGGATWTQIPTPTSNLLVRVVHAGPGILVAVGTGGTVLRSEDEGGSWTAAAFPAQVVLRGCDFRDSLHGITVGTEGVIGLTSDGGRTWTQVGAPPDVDQFRQVRYLTRDTLIAVGFSRAASKLMVSFDGGHSWKANEPAGLLTYAGFMGMTASASRVGVAVGLNHLIARSEDGGLSWSVLSTMPTTTTGASSSVTFQQVGDADSLHLFATGTRGQFYSSSDGGRTWNNRRVTGSTNADLGGMIVVSRDSVIVFSNQDSVYTTGDGGRSWKGTWYLRYQKSPFTVGRVEMVGDSVGFGRYSYFLDRYVFRTSDRGKTWFGVVLDSTDSTFPSPFAFSFPTPAIGFVAATGYDTSDIQFGAVYKSSDSGRTWVRQQIPPCGAMLSIHFRTPLLGIGGGGNGQIFRTSDGGEHWVEVLSDTTMNMLDVRFINDTLAYAVGNRAGVYETIDAGLTWRKLDLWNGAPPNTAFYFNGIYSDDGRHVYLTGPSGFAMKDFGEFPHASDVVEDRPRPRPEDGWSVQVRPNPARDTRIVISAPEGESVTSVDIVDVRGSLVARLETSLTDGAGEQTFIWDARDVPAGIYVARMAASGGTRSALILVE